MDRLKTAQSEKVKSSIRNKKEVKFRHERSG
jgi:hypothetical protein